MPAKECKHEEQSHDCDGGTADRTRLYAAIINYVGNNHVGYWNACMDSLGQPGFTACSYVYWNNTKNYMQGVVDTYYISAPMICPGGRENYSPECVEFWVNYDNGTPSRPLK